MFLYDHVNEFLDFCIPLGGNIEEQVRNFFHMEFFYNFSLLPTLTAKPMCSIETNCCP